MLDAYISLNSSQNKEENEQVTYIAETLHMNELIVQLLKYVVNARAVIILSCLVASLQNYLLYLCDTA